MIKTKKARAFLHLAMVLGVVLLVNGWFWNPTAALVDHPGRVNTAQHQAFLQLKPKLTLIGNSILRTAVEPEQFNAMTGVPTVRYTLDGSDSACWYLMLKNVVFTCPHKPRAVPLFFREHYLTDPTSRTHGKWNEYLDANANKEEPLLDRLAYLDNMSFPEYALSRYCSLYRHRNRSKEKLEQSARNAVASVLLHRDPSDVDASIQKVFASENMSVSLLTARQTEEETATELRQFNFRDQVKKSFLPHLLDLGRENNARMIFVRLRRRADAQNRPPSPPLQQYIRDLREYLEKNDAIYIDFSAESRLTLDLYADGDHLTPQGQALFTALLAERLQPVLQPRP